MIYAPRGIGKTFFGLGITYAVASSGQFIKWSAPKPQGVLLLDGEMPGPVLQERLACIALSSSKEATAPFMIVTPDLQEYGMPDLTSEAGRAAIDELLTPDIKLIVVDNISTLSKAKENDADSWLPVQGWALQQRARGRTVLFIHHSGKGGQQRGTSRREDVLDTVIALRRPGDYQPSEGARFEIHFEKARGIYGDDVKAIEAQLTTDQYNRQTWSFTDLEDSMTHRIARLLGDGLKHRDIAEELDISRGTVAFHAKKAKALGLAVIQGGKTDDD